MRRALSVGLPAAVALLFVAALVPPGLAQSPDDQGPLPDQPEPVVAGTGALHVSPPRLKVGEKVTASFTSTGGVTWGIKAPEGARCSGEARVTNNIHLPIAREGGPDSCSWTVTASTNRQWVTVEANIVGPCGDAELARQGKIEYAICASAVARDSYLVLDGYAISGRLAYPDGRPMPGVTVVLRGPKNGSKRTNASGKYFFEVPPGMYTVAARADVCVVPRREGNRCSQSGDVRVAPSREVNFESRLLGSIQGLVRDTDNNPLSGVRVEAEGGGERFSATTGADGRYAVHTEGNETYTVKPKGENERERYEPLSQRASVTSTQPVMLDDFVLDPTLYLEIEFDRESVAADGAGLVRATVTAKNARDDPAANKEVKIEPNRTGDPKALVCDSGGGGLLWPTRDTGGGLSTLSFRRRTSPGGRIRLDIFTGTESGTWKLSVSDPNEPTSDDYKELSITGGARGSGIPPDLISQFAAANAHAVSIGPSGSRESAAQRVLMRWLLQLRGHAQSRTIFTQLDFAPIHATDSQGAQHAGVAIFPAGQRPSFAGGSAETVVIDAEGGFTRAVVAQGQQATGELIPLNEWEQGRAGSLTGGGGGDTPRQRAIAAHGTAVFGSLEPPTNEDFTFLGFPYPPGLAGANYHRLNRCLGRGADLSTTTVHSPVQLMFTDANDKRLGFDTKGKLLTELEGLVSQDAKSTAYALTPGTYDIALHGTDKGTATIVIDQPGIEASTVLSFASRKGAKGTMTIPFIAEGESATPSTIPTLTFDNKQIDPRSGVAMKFEGLPTQFKPKSKLTLKGKVVDEFGQPVAGASVGAEGAFVETQTDSAGKFEAQVVTPDQSKPINLGASAPGYAAAKHSINPPPPVAARVPPPVTQLDPVPKSVQPSSGMAARLAVILLILVATGTVGYFRQSPAALQTTIGELQKASEYAVEAAKRVREGFKKPE